jgi:hypothetical protein
VVKIDVRRRRLRQHDPAIAAMLTTRRNAWSNPMPQRRTCC